MASPITAAATPPTTSAPFTADHQQPELHRQRRAQRRQHQRRRALQRVLEGEPGAERAAEHHLVDVQRVQAIERPERRRTGATSRAIAARRDEQRFELRQQARASGAPSSWRARSVLGRSPLPGWSARARLGSCQ